MDEQIYETDPHMEPAEQTARHEPVEAAPEKGFLSRIRIGMVLLWLAVLASIALNLVVLRQLAFGLQVAQVTLTDAISVIDAFQEQSFTYTVVVDENIVVDDNIPLQTTIPVEIHETVPVGGAAEVPIIGSIPISTAAQVDMVVDVPIDENFPLYLEVPVYLEIPIEIRIADTPLNTTLADIRARLVNLQENLTRLQGLGLVAPPSVESE